MYYSTSTIFRNTLYITVYYCILLYITVYYCILPMISDWLFVRYDVSFCTDQCLLYTLTYLTRAL